MSRYTRIFWFLFLFSGFCAGLLFAQIAQEDIEQERPVTMKTMSGTWSCEEADGELFYIILKPLGRASSFWSGESGTQIIKGTWEFADGKATATWPNGYRDVLVKRGNEFYKDSFRPDQSLDQPPTSSVRADQMDSNAVGSLTVPTGKPEEFEPSAPISNSLLKTLRNDYIGFWEVQKRRGDPFYILIKRGGKSAAASRDWKKAEVSHEGSWEISGDVMTVTWESGDRDEFRPGDFDTYEFRAYAPNGSLDYQAEAVKTDANKVGSLFEAGTTKLLTITDLRGIWRVKDGNREPYFISIENWGISKRTWYMNGESIGKESGRWDMLKDGIAIVWESGFTDVLRLTESGMEKFSYTPNTPITSVAFTQSKAELVRPEVLDRFIAMAEAEIEAKQISVSEARRLAEEEDIRRAKAESARIRAAEEARLLAIAEAKRRAEEEARRRAEEEALRRAQEVARKRAAEEALRRAEEQSKQKAREEARRLAEEEARVRAGEDARKHAEKEAKRMAEEKRLREETERRMAKEAQLRAQAEERERLEAEARSKAEKEMRLQNEKGKHLEAERKAKLEAEEMSKRMAEAEAMKKAQAEEARLTKLEKMKAEQLTVEERAKMKEVEEERIRVEREAQKRAEEEAKRQEEMKKSQLEEEARRQAEEEEAKRKAAEEIRMKEAEEARIRSEEMAHQEAEKKAQIMADNLKMAKAGQIPPSFSQEEKNAIEMLRAYVVSVSSDINAASESLKSLKEEEASLFLNEENLESQLREIKRLMGKLSTNKENTEREYRSLELSKRNGDLKLHKLKALSVAGEGNPATLENEIQLATEDITRLAQAVENAKSEAKQADQILIDVNARLAFEESNRAAIVAERSAITSVRKDQERNLANLNRKHDLGREQVASALVALAKGEIHAEDISLPRDFVASQKVSTELKPIVASSSPYVGAWKVADREDVSFYLEVKGDGTVSSTWPKSPDGFKGQTGRWEEIAQGCYIAWIDGSRNILTETASGPEYQAVTAGRAVRGTGLRWSDAERIHPSKVERWDLVFEDNFDLPTIDRTKWTVGYPWKQVINNELGGYADENVNVENGKLVITATDYEVEYGGKSLNYSTGAVTTFGKFEQAYGYYEIRARIPEGRGLWPAFWMITRSGPPEIDILDVLGHEPDKANFTLITKDPTGRPNKQTMFAKGTDYSRTFHTIGLEWTPHALIYTIDGQEVHRFTKDIPNEPMYLVLSLAVGGNWPGPPNGWTPFPAYYEIEHIRVFSKR